MKIVFSSLSSNLPMVPITATPPAPAPAPPPSMTRAMMMLNLFGSNTVIVDINDSHVYF